MSTPATRAQRRALDWPTLVERLEKLCASGRPPWPNDLISDFSNAEPS